MKKEHNLTLGISEPDKVDAFLSELKTPLINEIKYLRSIILQADKKIGEGIYWNAPTFYYIGKLDAFDPKTYKRYIVGFNFHQKDCIRMIFLKGAEAKDLSGILEGDYKDGRRLLSFKSRKEIKSKEKELIVIIKSLIKFILQ